MQLSTSVSVGSFIRDRLKNYEATALVYDFGRVLQTSDGVVRLEGLTGSRYGELLEFENDVFGMALDLSSDGVGAVLLNDIDKVRVGSTVRGTGRVLKVPVGPNLLGRVVDPIGRPLDGDSINADEYRAIESPAPVIISRQDVCQPLETGLMAIDSMIPIGKGQRELIIGDRQTGKTTIAIDAILNQAGKDVICVYVAIGQKASTVSQIVNLLHMHGAMDNTVVVASTASDYAAMQYIAPYSGCAIAESFMYAGKDVLIVYDDLSKHAVAYRAMSLLLHRPPGREAYPGDVFYLHSRLLERAAKLSNELGGGSLTALPIVETAAGDISAYIPTNVISITDGQIFLESELFHSGVRPAVNVGLSVSRVGRAAQTKAMKKVSGKLRLDLAQYRELAVFAQFGADIDGTTRELLSKGARLTEVLKQGRDQLYKLSEQTALLLAFNNNAFKDVPITGVTEFKRGLLERIWLEQDEHMRAIDRTGELTDLVRDEILATVKRYVEAKAIR